MAAKSEISDTEIADYYEANKKLFELPETVHARHILLKVANTDSPEKVEATKKRAMGILEEAKKPGQILRISPKIQRRTKPKTKR